MARLKGNGSVMNGGLSKESSEYLKMKDHILPVQRTKRQRESDFNQSGTASKLSCNATICQITEL